MSIAFVQGRGNGSGFGGTGISLAYNSNNAAGNCLVVASLALAISGNVSSISDTQGNIYVNVFQDFASNGASNTLFLSVWVAPNCKAGANTVSVAFSSGQNFGNDIAIAEYSGVKSSSVVDVSGIQNTTSSPFSTPAKTTTLANDWILGIATGNLAANEPTVTSSGYQARVTETTGRYGLLLVDSNAAEPIGAYSVAFTSPGILNTAGLVALSPVALAPVGGGGGVGSLGLGVGLGPMSKWEMF